MTDSAPPSRPPHRADRAARLALAGALSALGISVAEAQSVGGAEPVPIEIAQLTDPPLPRPNPERSPTDPEVVAGPEQPAPPMLAPVLLPAPDLLFSSAYRRFEAADFASAVRIARAAPDPVTGAVIDWLVATEGYPRADFATVSGATANLAGWPGQALMRIRFEQAFLRTEPTPESVVETLGPSPTLEASTLLLAESLVALGRDPEATNLVRAYWRDRNFSLATEEALIAEFGDVLTGDDHRWRMSRLLYGGFNAEGLRTAEFLSADTQALAEAWAAVNAGSNNAASLLEDVPAAARSDPGYQFATLRRLIRSGNLDQAVVLLASSPTDPVALVDPEAWAQQRLALGWTLVNRGDDLDAYDVLSEHPAIDRAAIVELEFQAGWVALRRLDDPEAAVQHFQAIVDGSTLPLSQSRGAYWLGRALEAAGRSAEAETAYRIAGRFPTTFYGQLALDRLGEAMLTLAPAPVIDAAVEAAFAANPYVAAMGWFESIGRDVQVDLFARFLADTLTDPAEIALLGRFADGLGNHQLALQIGKLAANRGLAVDTVAFPTAAIPAGVESDRIDMAFIYAIARQESAFDTHAVSSAGARGLLQLLPSTAEEAAQSLRLTYSEGRLTADPAFNAIVGGAYIRSLLDRYDGSVILALAAYNAGMSRADDWIVAYGDPREPGVDPIDWIERIPFDETRNYVQRVVENLEVYRALLGNPALVIAEDLGLRD